MQQYKYLKKVIKLTVDIKEWKGGKVFSFVCSNVISYIDYWLKILSRAMRRYESKLKLLILP
jgi:hypothetical protein